MTSVDSPPSQARIGASAGGAPLGDRVRRLRERRRLVREEALVVLVLLVALAVTVIVLAMQWLGSAPSVGAVSSLLVQGVH